MTQHLMEFNSSVQMEAPLESWKVQEVVGEHFVSAPVVDMWQVFAYLYLFLRWFMLIYKWFITGD